MKTTKRTAFPELSVVKLARGEWRISLSQDPDELLGFIERQSGGRFEILWMSDPMRWAYVDTFDLAILAFGDSARFTGETVGSRSEPSPVRAASGSSPRQVVRSHRTTWVNPQDRSTVA